MRCTFNCFADVQAQGFLAIGFEVDERRLLYVITDLDVGGVPLHLLRLAPSVARSGWRVRVVSLSPVGPVGDRLREAGIEVVSCNAAGGRDWRVFGRLAGIIRDYDPLVIHSFLFHANLACRFARLLCGFPGRRLVCEIQTAEIERKWHLTVDRYTHWLSAFTIGNSQSVVDHLHEHARIPKGRLRLVPGGVNVERISAANRLEPAELGVAQSDKVLLWVGRIDPVKGLDILLAALARIVENLPVKLLIAGDGEHRKAVEADVSKFRLQDRVVFLGRRNDVDRLCKSADLFVFPSRTEGMPNALLEAMAASLPVVTANVPGCRDLVTNGQTGWLVEAEDVEGLAQAIVDAFEKPDLTREMVARAESFVRGEYTEQRCHQRYLDLYAQVSPF